MTLEKAIEHSEHLAAITNGTVGGADLKQLHEWLKELKQRRKAPNGAKLLTAVMTCVARLALAENKKDPAALAGLLAHVRNILQDALLEPPRNCDVYPDYGEAISVWTATNIMIHPGRTGAGYPTARLVFPAWLLAKAKDEDPRYGRV